VLPKTTYEQRSPNYGDVESLLSPGFLTHSARVAGVAVHLRSLGPGDVFMLRARAHGASDRDWRIWMVASSIWMIDGRAVLGQDSVVPFLAEYLRALPAFTVNALFYLALGLFVRANRATETVQVYCYEYSSRYKWATYGMQMSSGVSGAETLGQNLVQQVWQAYNTLEDRRNEEERQWEASKLVASSNAPKAIKKLDSKDQQKRQERIKDREAKTDLYYYQQLGVVDKKGQVEGTDGSMHRIQGAKTVEDLEDEMKRWVTEDYDLHDKVIAEYKGRIRAQHEQEALERDARRMALERKREEMGWETGSFRPKPLMALTAEQLQYHLQQRQMGKPGVTFIPQAPKKDRLYDKYVDEGAVVSGELQVVNGQVVDPNANAAADARTLAELIKDRSPAFGSGE
jgi:hypothetical protein